MPENTNYDTVESLKREMTTLRNEITKGSISIHEVEDRLRRVETELAVLKNGIFIQLDAVKTDVSKISDGVSRIIWIGVSILLTGIGAWILNGGLML